LKTKTVYKFGLNMKKMYYVIGIRAMSKISSVDNIYIREIHAYLFVESSPSIMSTVDTEFTYVGNSILNKTINFKNKFLILKKVPLNNGNY